MSIETNSTEMGTGAFGGEERRAERRVEVRRDHDDDFALVLQAGTLDEVCRTVLADVRARFPERVLEYAPDPDPELRGDGEWDLRRVGYAVTILLEDALKRSSAGQPVSLRWREHDGVVVLRVQFARPLEPGDRFVTFFEDGVRPDGADDTVGTLRIVAARKIVRQHRGHLGRIRTRAGTAYVVTLPRAADRDAAEADALELEG
jgi:signal transduction histidine kinase